MNGNNSTTTTTKGSIEKNHFLFTSDICQTIYSINQNTKLQFSRGFERTNSFFFIFSSSCLEFAIHLHVMKQYLTTIYNLKEKKIETRCLPSYAKLCRSFNLNTIYPFSIIYQIDNNLYPFVTIKQFFFFFNIFMMENLTIIHKLVFNYIQIIPNLLRVRIFFSTFSFALNSCEWFFFVWIQTLCILTLFEAN